MTPKKVKPSKELTIKELVASGVEPSKEALALTRELLAGCGFYRSKKKLSKEFFTKAENAIAGQVAAMKILSEAATEDPNDQIRVRAGKEIKRILLDKEACVIRLLIDLYFEELAGRRKSSRLTKEPRAYSAHELRKASELTKVPRAYLEQALRQSSLLEKNQLNKVQKALWDDLPAAQKSQFREYISEAEAGNLSTLAQNMTYGQRRAIRATLKTAADRDFASDEIPEYAKLVLKKEDPTGPGLWVFYSSWGDACRAMDCDPEDFAAKKQVYESFMGLGNLVATVAIFPNSKNGKKFILDPACQLAKSWLVHHVTDGGQDRTGVLVWIHEELVRDANKFNALTPANLEELIKIAAKKAGFPRVTHLDALFIDLLYYLAAERSAHKGEISLTQVADRCGLWKLFKAQKWGEIETRLSRPLQIAIQGGWLLPESRIENRKLIWVRNPEKFPGGKKAQKPRSNPRVIQ